MQSSCMATIAFLWCGVAFCDVQPQLRGGVAYPPCPDGDIGNCLIDFVLDLYNNKSRTPYVPDATMKLCNMSTESCHLDDLMLNPGEESLVYPGGSTRCIHEEPHHQGGGAFSFKVRKGMSDSKLMIYFEGGGACFFARDQEWVEACHDGGWSDEGIFSQAPKHQSENPFSDYTIVQVRYCSGDAYVGNVQVPGDGSREQRGYENAKSVLDWAKAAGFASTLDSLIISGSSAGAIGAQLWARSWLQSFDYKKAAVIADSYAGVYPQDTQGPVFSSYGVCGTDVLDDALVQACQNGNISLQAVVTNLLQNNATVTFASIDSKHDWVQTGFYELISDKLGQGLVTPRGVRGVYDEFEQQLFDVVNTYARESKNTAFYLVKKDRHTFLDYQNIYKTNLCGPKGGPCLGSNIDLITWLRQVVGSKTPASQCNAIFSKCPSHD